MIIKTLRRHYLTPQVLWNYYHKDMAKVLMVLTDGNEETEAVVPADILRRAGAALTIAKVHINPGDETSLIVKCARGIKLQADAHFSEVHGQTWDLIMVPGGPGVANLNKSKPFIELLKKQKADGKWIGAICAAPATVLAVNGILDGEKATAHPSEQEKLPDKSMAKEYVVVSNKIVTSQGPGTAIIYGLKLTELLFGKAKCDEVKKQIIAI